MSHRTVLGLTGGCLLALACELHHDYPEGTNQAGHGDAHFTAAPATKYGCYMTILNDCG